MLRDPHLNTLVVSGQHLRPQFLPVLASIGHGPLQPERPSTTLPDDVTPRSASDPGFGHHRGGVDLCGSKLFFWRGLDIDHSTMYSVICRVVSFAINAILSKGLGYCRAFR